VILSISTSSPVVSLAFIYEGKVLIAREEHAPRAASRAILVMLESMMQERGLEQGHITGVVSDVGPGSFTGVKVGVMAAKTLAFARGLRCGGIDAFSLVSRDETVAIGSRKGEWILKDGSLVNAVPEGAMTTPPHAGNLLHVMDRIIWEDPVTMVPRYMLEPSISTPKQEILKKVIGTQP